MLFLIPCSLKRSSPLFHCEASIVGDREEEEAGGRGRLEMEDERPGLSQQVTCYICVCLLWQVAVPSLSCNFASGKCDRAALAAPSPEVAQMLTPHLHLSSFLSSTSQDLRSDIVAARHSSHLSLFWSEILETFWTRLAVFLSFERVGELPIWLCVLLTGYSYITVQDAFPGTFPCLIGSPLTKLHKGRDCVPDG